MSESKVTVSMLKNCGVHEYSLQTNLTHEGFEKLSSQIKEGLFDSQDLAPSGKTLIRNLGAYFHQKNKDVNVMRVTNLFTKELMLHGIDSAFLTLPELWDAVLDPEFIWPQHLVVFGLQDEKTNPYVAEPMLQRRLEGKIMKFIDKGHAFSFATDLPNAKDVRLNDWYTNRFLQMLSQNTIEVAL